MVGKNPRKALSVLSDIDKLAIKKGRLKTGKGRVGQASSKVWNSKALKEAVLTTGGYGGSVAGGSTGIPGLSIVGDNLGTLGTRKAVNAVYAKTRRVSKVAKARAKGLKNPPGSAGKTRKAIERLEKRKGSYGEDQIGLVVGNGVVSATPGLNIPFRGALASKVAVPHIASNLKQVIKRKKSIKQGIKDTLKDIKNGLNLKEKIRKGNARERLYRQKLSKKINS